MSPANDNGALSDRNWIKQNPRREYRITRRVTGPGVTNPPGLTAVKVTQFFECGTSRCQNIMIIGEVVDNDRAIAFALTNYHKVLVPDFLENARRRWDERQ